MTPGNEQQVDRDADAQPGDGVWEHRQAEAAAAEAGAIGGPASNPELPPSEQPRAEAGEGEAGGFEQAESDLVEHASHGDQHAARRAIEDSDRRPEEPQQDNAAEPDHFLSSEVDDDR